MGFFIDGGAGGDFLVGDRLAGRLDRRSRAVDPRLDVQLARGGDEQPDMAAADQIDNFLAHLEAGFVEILPDIGEALIVAVGRRVGIVGKYRNAGLQGGVGRAVEGFGVDDGDGDGIGLAGDGGVHRVHHLADHGGLRAGPLVIATEIGARVLDAILRRHEERVGGDVIHEYQLPALMLGQGARFRRLGGL